MKAKPKRQRPSDFTQARAKLYSIALGKHLLETNEQAFRRRAAKRRENRRIKKSIVQFVEQQVAAMNLQNFMHSEYADLRRQLPAHLALQMLSYTINKHILSFTDLPKTKKRIIERLANYQGAATRAAFSSITKKTALGILQELEQAIKIAHTETIKPDREQIMEMQESLKAVEAEKARVQSTPGGRVRFDEEFAEGFMSYSSLLIQRMLDAKNSFLLQAANIEVERTLAEITRGKH